MKLCSLTEIKDHWCLEDLDPTLKYQLEVQQGNGPPKPLKAGAG